MTRTLFMLVAVAFVGCTAFKFAGQGSPSPVPMQPPEPSVWGLTSAELVTVFSSIGTAAAIIVHRIWFHHKNGKGTK